MSLQDAFSKPEAFDSSLFQASSQQACFDDVDSHAVGKQTTISHSIQSRDTAAVQDYFMAEQRINLDNRHGECLEADEEESSIARFHTLAVSESEDSVDRAEWRETTYRPTAQSMKHNEDGGSEQSPLVERIFYEESVSADEQRVAVVDGKLPTQEVAVQQPSERGDESVLEVQISRTGVSEERAVLQQEDQRDDECQDITEEKEHSLNAEKEESCRVSFEFTKTVSTRQGETVEVVAPQRFEEQPAESVLSENVAAAELPKECHYDGDGKTGAVRAMSFAVCSDKLSPENFEAEPVYLPVLSELTSTADIGYIRQQPLAQADVNATRVVFCVEPVVHELPESQLATYYLKVAEVDAVQLEMCEVGHLVEATMKLPECECGVLEMAAPDAFDEFVVHLELPEITTVDVVELPRERLLTLLPAVESDEGKVSVGTIADKQAGIQEGDLSCVTQLSGIEMRHEEKIVKYSAEIQHADIYLPEMLDVSSQLTMENRVGSQELPGAESEIGWLAIWKYEADDRSVDTSSDLGEKVLTPTSATKFCESSSERNHMRHLMEEDLEMSMLVGFAESESPTLEVNRKHRDLNRKDDEDAETVTSDEWCVVEKERGAGFDVKITEDKDIKEVPGLSEEFVYDSSADDTSTEKPMLTTSCTSNVVYVFDHFGLQI